MNQPNPISEITTYAHNIVPQPYPLQKVSDAYEIQQILKENIAFDETFNFKKLKEIKQFLQFSGQMIFAFPIGLLMRKIIRKNKRLNYILQFPELQSIRNNIEKGSFAYDTLLFKHLPHQIITNKSHLANLVCLALLFGDEFIDGIATTFGKENVQAILTNSKYNFDLQYKKEGANFALYYQFDICTILPQDVLEKQNTKYAINYKEFYDHLLFLLAEMNRQLKKLPIDLAQKAAHLICKVCNKCFDTYKVDVQDFTQDYDWSKLINYQQSKDDEIVKILLELRGELLQKNKPKYQQNYGSWAYMVRSMQVYDDMQDIAADCDYQMNFLAFFAKSFFTNEWQWLEHNKFELQTEDSFTIQQKVALHMPCAMMLCMEYNKNISFKNLNWVQQKIQNYLWRKNWLGIKNKQILHYDFETTFKDLANKIIPITHDMITEQMKHAHLLDAALLFPIIREQIFAGISNQEKYCLKNFYTTLSLQFKASITQKMLRTI
jgi:hypothetical protein